MTFNTVTCLAAGLLIIGLAPATRADAAQVYRGSSQNGGNGCTGALPTYEGALRKRPRAIANEGSTTAFVTCSTMYDGAGIRPLTVHAWFTNSNAAPVTISCTLVEGSALSGGAFTATTKVFAAGLSDGIPLRMDPAGTARAMSVSCALPPGVALTTFDVAGYQEVGL